MVLPVFVYGYGTLKAGQWAFDQQSPHPVSRTLQCLTQSPFTQKSEQSLRHRFSQVAEPGHSAGDAGVWGG
jgi:hypothetical protein